MAMTRMSPSTQLSSRQRPSPSVYPSISEERPAYTTTARTTPSIQSLPVHASPREMPAYEYTSPVRNHVTSITTTPTDSRHEFAEYTYVSLNARSKRSPIGRSPTPGRSPATRSNTRYTYSSYRLKRLWDHNNIKKN
mmetsp:Transcript_30609/g.55407  ORF Transcript_30609/g.55407 Transcript_30609/m.55407 type:complete len:137 (-) Transcript_30609:1349-1759(-)